MKKVVKYRLHDDAGRSYKTFRCKQCGKSVSKKSPRLLCRECIEAGKPEQVEREEVLSKNQIRKQARRLRREARERLRVPPSGVAPEEVEDWLDLVAVSQQLVHEEWRGFQLEDLVRKDGGVPWQPS